MAVTFAHYLDHARAFHYDQLDPGRVRWGLLPMLSFTGKRFHAPEFVPLWIRGLEANLDRLAEVNNVEVTEFRAATRNLAVELVTSLSEPLTKRDAPVLIERLRELCTHAAALASVAASQPSDEPRPRAQLVVPGEADSVAIYRGPDEDIILDLLAPRKRRASGSLEVVDYRVDLAAIEAAKKQAAAAAKKLAAAAAEEAARRNGDGRRTREAARPAGATTDSGGPHPAYVSAVNSFERVRLEWDDIVTDPLSALEHASLLDPTNPRTAAFIEAFGEAVDLLDLYPTCPEQPETVERVVRVLRSAKRTWGEAKRFAAHLSYSWLPEEERETAAKVATLLKMAGNEGATLHERAAAAEKALGMLRTIHTIILPEPSLILVEAIAAKQIMPASA